MLRCVFDGYTSIPNTIPASVGITSAGMLAFFLFWLVHFFFCAFRPYQLRWFFTFKVAVMLPAVFGLFIFCMVNTKANVGSVYAGSITSGKAWFVLQAINAGMGNTASLITNQPDIARWSKTKTGAMWSQLFTNPIAVTLSASLGILATAAINNSWGLQLWNPWDLLSAILDKYWDAGTRTAIFLAAFCWMFSILGTNIAANMIPFGSDVTLLFPKYLTIPRGQYLVEFLAFAICPWKILASASVFTTFLAGYGLFMASVVAVMIADCKSCAYDYRLCRKFLLLTDSSLPDWMLTKGNVFVGWLYDPGKSNRYYHYHAGCNIQAYIAYLSGIALPFAGFAGTLGASVSDEALHLGSLGWMISFIASFTVYYGLCLVWPTRNQRLIKEQGLGWEQAASDEFEAPDGVAIYENGSRVYAAESADGDESKKTPY